MNKKFDKEWEFKPLPPEGLIETEAILRKANSAHRYLAELKGVSSSIPNQNILVNTWVTQPRGLYQKG